MTLQEEFQSLLGGALKRAGAIGKADVVVGIPFLNEFRTIGEVVRVVAEGLRRCYPDRKSVIVCAGSPLGREALEVADASLRELGSKGASVEGFAFLLEDERFNGKGWALRAIMEIARELDADLVVFEADLGEGDLTEGYSLEPAEWVCLLLDPILQQQADLVLPRFNFPLSIVPIADLLIYPLLGSIYGWRIREPLSGELGISSSLVNSYLEEWEPWYGDVSQYGIQIWLTTKALTDNAKICEAGLGFKNKQVSPGKRDLVLRQAIKTFFEQVVEDSEWWVGRVDTVYRPPTVGIPRSSYHPPATGLPDPAVLMTSFRQGFRKYDLLLKRVLPTAVYEELSRMCESQAAGFRFRESLWAETVYSFLLAFAYPREFVRGDILNALIGVCHGRMAGFLFDLREFSLKVAPIADEQLVPRLISYQAEELIEQQFDAFLNQRAKFRSSWHEEEQASKPFLPKVAYWEFIPGVPIALPQDLTSRNGETVYLAPIYEGLLKEYKSNFEEFVHERLSVPYGAGSYQIAQAIREFVRRLESHLEALIPGDLYSVSGVRSVARAILDTFTREDVYILRPEVASRLLRDCPPVNLLTKLGHDDVSAMLREVPPNNALALASWSESEEYLDRIWDWIKDSVRPEHFVDSPLDLVVVNHEDFPELVQLKEISALSKLTGRIVVSDLRKNSGGEFPRLRYFTTLGKAVVEAERFSRVWKTFAQERRAFGKRVIKSLEGHWSKSTLSAHNLFENGNQREFASRLQELIGELRMQGQTKKEGRDVPTDGRLPLLARDLEDAVSAYPLALTMPDGKFIPCSIWTWASYSFKGGKGFPTPLSLHVERDWFTREIVVRFHVQLGGTEREIDELITDLMGQGLEYEDISVHLFEIPEPPEAIVLKQDLNADQPLAGKLKRYEGNPILSPVESHWWESRYVLNCAALRLRGKIYLLYRAFGDDEVSRIGLAVTANGFEVEHREDTFIFGPEDETESRGCEDPRLTLIEDTIYMLYTAYDGIVPQIALASIEVDDFLNGQWKRWTRHGLVFPGFPNKDALLFPERFFGKYVMYHRIAPSMWVSFADEIRCPWAREGHRILMGPRSGLMWDATKIGAGAQPIKTEFGWLLIYHGVDHALVYRLGLILVSPNDPSKIIYRSPNPILEPETELEIGRPRESWVPNVVFTCGAAPLNDKEVLGVDDEVLVYYGAADTVICVAKAKLGDLIPVERLASVSKQV